MTITLKLKSGLEKILHKSIIEMNIAENACLMDILRELNFPADKAGVVLIDGRLGNKTCRLHEGETVKIFPQSIGC